MKLLLITALLLFYMQLFCVASKFTNYFTKGHLKKTGCIKYEVSTTAQTFEQSKAYCRKMGGKIAVSDLTNK